MILDNYPEVKTVLNQIVSILIIDDQEETRAMLSKILGDEGYLVETVKNGKDAIKAFKKTPFDIALVDIELPDIKGVELMVKLKEIQPKIINIIITGHPSLESAVQAVNYKADGYILKPFNTQALLETIRKTLAEKTNSYLQMLNEIESEKKKTPQIRFQSPDSWIKTGDTTT
jgi:DNA-binding NtrC family response regulator